MLDQLSGRSCAEGGGTPILIATSRAALETDPDLEVLRQSAKTVGLTVHVRTWDDPAQDWSASSLTLIRSCWDYYNHVPEFEAWAHAQPNLQNPLPYITWNLNKRYLRDLARLGIPTIDTVWNPRVPSDVPMWDRYVVKPAISASAHGVSAHRTAQRALYAARKLSRLGHDVLLQPYIHCVEAPGEICLTFYEGRRGISLRKASPLVLDSPLWEGAEETAGYTIEAVEERAWAAAEYALKAAAAIVGLDAPLYARVDLIPVATDYLLMELELIEPALFLFMSPESTAQLMAGIRRRLR